MQNTGLKVVIIYKVFNHYRKPIFDQLAEKVNLTVLHSLNDSWVKSASTDYSVKVPSISYGSKPTQVWLFVIKELFKVKPDVIIHEFNPSIISLHTSFIYSKLFKKKFVVWGHGYNKQTGFNPSKSFIQRVRLWYMKRANAVLLYGQEDKKLFSSFIDKNKIFVAQNTLDTEALKVFFDDLQTDGLQNVKDGLNITHKYNLLYIGRLVKDKLPELLLDINSYLLDKGLDVGIHYVGDGEMAETIKSLTLERGFNNVYMHGAIHDDKVSAKYLFISDLMIMPGYLGLSINHAFCFGCPVVSFEQGPEGPFHSPEVEYVIQNKTGYLASQDKPNDMEDWISSYLSNVDKQVEMKKEIEYMVDHIFPKSRMVDGIVDSAKY